MWLREVCLNLTPAIIAILLALTMVFLLIAHRDTADYKTPDELRNALTVIIGYYFGRGVSGATSSGDRGGGDEGG